MIATLLSLTLLTGQVGTVAIGGTATWYDGPAGHAAAGPGLRDALGSDWRGQRVTVCHESPCVSVILSDWCLCRGTRLVDLDDASFARLAPLSRGVIAVSVEYGGQAPTLPPTDLVYWSWPGGGPR